MNTVRSACYGKYVFGSNLTIDIGFVIICVKLSLFIQAYAMRLEACNFGRNFSRREIERYSHILSTE